jgi:hypothetical protein
VNLLGTSDTSELSDFWRNLRWWGFYIVVQVLAHVALTSVGAFFHFLLDHELSIVEGWVHNNGWELVASAKLFAAWVVHRLLKVRLYRPRGVREFFRDEWRWPEARSLVVTVFLVLILITMSSPVVQSQNGTYLSYHLTAYMGCLTWLMVDYFILAILQDLFPVSHSRLMWWRMVGCLAGFWLSLRLVVPDYFGTSIFMYLHFLSLIILAGPRLLHWSDVAAYVALFAAPMSALFGIDPIWGVDFAPLKFARLPAIPFLILIWMLSWAYYSYRHRLRLPRSVA